MKRDDSKQGNSERAHTGDEQQQSQRPAPGKVTLTSKLSPTRKPALQRRAVHATAAAPRRSLWDLAMDPAMDAAHRGVTALADSRQEAVQASPAASRPAAVPTPSPTAVIDPPQPGIDKPGFIDNDDGANIRTGPAELQGVALTAQPLPPATPRLRQRPAPRGARVVVRHRVSPGYHPARLRPGLPRQPRSPRAHGQAPSDQGW